MNRVEKENHQALFDWDASYRKERDSTDRPSLALSPSDPPFALLEQPPSMRHYFWEAGISSAGARPLGRKSVRSPSGIVRSRSSPRLRHSQVRGELSQRLSRMGSQRSPSAGRGTYDRFPGAQELSAAELIQASSMSFHMVHEAWTPRHETYKRFLLPCGGVARGAGEGRSLWKVSTGSGGATSTAREAPSMMPLR